MAQEQTVAAETEVADLRDKLRAATVARKSATDAADAAELELIELKRDHRQIKYVVGSSEGQQPPLFLFCFLTPTPPHTHPTRSSLAAAQEAVERGADTQRQLEERVQELEAGHHASMRVEAELRSEIARLQALAAQEAALRKQKVMQATADAMAQIERLKSDLAEARAAANLAQDKASDTAATAARDASTLGAEVESLRKRLADAGSAHRHAMGEAGKEIAALRAQLAATHKVRVLWACPCSPAACHPLARSPLHCLVSLHPRSWMSSVCMCLRERMPCARNWKCKAPVVMRRCEPHTTASCVAR